MKRNLESRVEILVPVESPVLQQQLRELLEAHAADQRYAWEMQADGSYARLELPDGCEDAQMVEYRRCQDDYARQIPHQRMLFAQSIRRIIGGALIRLGRQITPANYSE